MGASVAFFEDRQLSMLAYEHNRAEPVIRLWNEVHEAERPLAAV
jgi:hypothetical protein